MGTQNWVWLCFFKSYSVHYTGISLLAFLNLPLFLNNYVCDIHILCTSLLFPSLCCMSNLVLTECDHELPNATVTVPPSATSGSCDTLVVIWLVTRIGISNDSAIYLHQCAVWKAISHTLAKGWENSVKRTSK